MSLTIPHQSQQGIAVASGGRAANSVGAGAFMTPGRAAMPEALDRLARGVDRLGGTLFDIGVERRNRRNATALLEDQIEYEDALREFDSEYRQTKQGADALTAAEDYDAFHQERLDALREKWGGNPQLMESVSRMAEGIRAPSMNRAVAWRDQQEEAHKEAVGKAKWEQTLGKLGDPSLSYKERLGALKDSEASLRMLAGQRPVFNGKGEVTGYEGGGNVDAEIERRRRVFHGEQVETLIAQGKTGEASTYVRDNAGAFGEKSNDVLAAIREREERDAAKARMEAERARAEAEDAARRATEARNTAMLDGLRPGIAAAFEAGDDAAIATNVSAAYEAIAKIGDPERRYDLARSLEQDINFQRTVRDAGDMAAAENLWAQAEAQGWSPAQTRQKLEEAPGFSRNGKASLLAQIDQGRANTSDAQKMRGFDEMRVMLDTRRREGNPMSEQEMKALAWDLGLTTTQVKELNAKRLEGGLAGNPEFARRVDALYKDLIRDGSGPPAGFYDIVANNFPPGTDPTAEELRRDVSTLLLSRVPGESAGTGMWNMNTRHTFPEASKRGYAYSDAWLPDISDDEERAELALEVQARIESGEMPDEPITDEVLRDYKRIYRLGLPPRNLGPGENGYTGAWLYAYGEYL